MKKHFLFLLIIQVLCCHGQSESVYIPLAEPKSNIFSTILDKYVLIEEPEYYRNRMVSLYANKKDSVLNVVVFLGLTDYNYDEMKTTKGFWPYKNTTVFIISDTTPPLFNYSKCKGKKFRCHCGIGYIGGQEWEFDVYDDKIRVVFQANE